MDPTQDPSRNDGPTEHDRSEGVRKPFLSPRLIGARFDHHAIPLDVLKDLAALEELIVEVAKWQYIQDNPGRQRTPKGFSRGVQLELTGVGEGSARPLISLAFLASQATLYGQENAPYFERSRDAIVRAVEAAEHDRPDRIREHLPEKYLDYFQRIGRSLRPDEAMLFAPPEGKNGPRLDPKSRRTLIFASQQAQDWTAEVSVRGRVCEFDQAKDSFEIQLASGQRIPATVSSAHLDIVFDALRKYKDGQRIAVLGVGRFNRENRLERIESIEHVSALDALDVDAQLEQIAELRDGWLDGHGRAPSNAGLEWLAAAFAEHFDDDLALPYLYPTESGGIQAEWPVAGGEASLEIDLERQAGLWDCTFFDEREDQEETVDLTDAQGWRSIALWLRKAGGLGK